MANYTPTDNTFAFTATKSGITTGNANEEPTPTDFPADRMLAYKITFVITTFVVNASAPVGGSANMTLTMQYWDGSTWQKMVNDADGIDVEITAGVIHPGPGTPTDSQTGTKTMRIQIPAQRAVSDIKFRAYASWINTGDASVSSDYNCTGTWSVTTYNPGGILAA